MKRLPCSLIVLCFIFSLPISSLSTALAIPSCTDIFEENQDDFGIFNQLKTEFTTRYCIGKFKGKQNDFGILNRLTGNSDLKSTDNIILNREDDIEGDLKTSQFTKPSDKKHTMIKYRNHSESRFLDGGGRSHKWKTPIPDINSLRRNHEIDDDSRMNEFINLLDKDDLIVNYRNLSKLNYLGGDIAFTWKVEAHLLPNGKSQIEDISPYISFNDINAPAPVPEPSTLLLLGTGLAGFVIAKRKKFMK